MYSYGYVSWIGLVLFRMMVYSRRLGALDDKAVCQCLCVSSDITCEQHISQATFLDLFERSEVTLVFNQENTTKSKNLLGGKGTAIIEQN